MKIARSNTTTWHCWLLYEFVTQISSPVLSTKPSKLVRLSTCAKMVSIISLGSIEHNLVHDIHFPTQSSICNHSKIFAWKLCCWYNHVVVRSVVSFQSQSQRLCSMIASEIRHPNSRQPLRNIHIINSKALVIQKPDNAKNILLSPHEKGRRRD